MRLKKVATIAAVFLVCAATFFVLIIGHIDLTTRHIDRQNVRRQMRQILIGATNYFDVHRQMPTNGGSHEMSWRVPTLVYGGYFGSGSDGDSASLPRYAEVWNSEYNRQFERAGCKMFSYPGRCPETFALATVGDDTLWSEHAIDNGRESVDVDTIILIEIPSSKQHWMAPGDFDIGVLRGHGDTSIGEVLSLHGDAICVGFADETVWELSSETPATLLMQFMTISGANRMDRTEAFERYKVE